MLAAKSIGPGMLTPISIMLRALDEFLGQEERMAKASVSLGIFAQKLVVGEV